MIFSHDQFVAQKAKKLYKNYLGFIHPTQEILPLSTVIKRALAWHNPETENGISSCWNKMENFIKERIHKE